MDKICFYNMNHLGDIYFSSLFINLIAEQNKDMVFYYFCISGDCFFYKNTNLIKLNKTITNKYNKELVSGEPPENLLDNDFLTIFNLLKENNLEKKQFNTININNNSFLFINTWCMSPLIHFEDFNIQSSIQGWNNLLYHLNLNLTKKINFVIKDRLDLVNIFTYYDNENINKETLKDKVFIFNYKPRSLTLKSMDNIINQISQNHKVLLANYEEKYSNNPNISFFDKEYNIYPTPDCINLIKMWDIIIHCKKIIIIPSGSSFTFFHKLKEIKKEQIYMFSSHHYCTILNNTINYLLDKQINLINII